MNILVKSICYEPLGCSLRVTEIDYLRSSCCLQNVVQISRYIILSHFMEGKVPESFVLNGIVQMLVRVNSASAVGNPHIIAPIDELETQVKSRIVKEPGTSIVYKTVLHIDRHFDFTWSRFEVEFPRDPEGSEYEEILCDN